MRLECRITWLASRSWKPQLEASSQCHFACKNVCPRCKQGSNLKAGKGDLVLLQWAQRCGWPRNEDLLVRQPQQESIWQ